MSTRRARSRQAEETLTAEFTSGQLIIGICAALFVALVCFLIGVLVGKVDPSTNAPAIAAVSTDTNSKSPAREGVQTTQTNLVDRASNTVTRESEPQEVELPTNNTRSASRSGNAGRGKFVPAPDPANRARNTDNKPKQSNAITVRPASNTGGMAIVEKPGDSPLPKAPASDLPPPANMDKPEESKPEEKPEETKVAANIPLKELPTIPKEKPEEKPAPEPKPAPAPKKLEEKPAPKPTPTPAPPAATGAFGVQVASFLGAERAQKAAEYQRRLRENANIESRIFPSEDGSAQRVIIVGYADKAAAAAACAELRKKEAFKGAFVKALP